MYPHRCAPVLVFHQIPDVTVLSLTQSLIIAFSIDSKQLRNRISLAESTPNQGLIDVSLPIKYSRT
ncbi:Hypothetical protein CpCap5W_1827 [Corynebacterium pseudotuberculosis]|nr:Hypothetical protein Cp4202_0866 [Corynebacterium pseudotuberculosis 42/02-A]AEX39354.1 Hypothetical protein Cp3995_0889 [Corynebacterium pseudotuberculosis 3/99-5]AFF22028.1 Hypothetical protein CpP54B96_0887 [Corynebacterium pseudotuberculosis P54B96]AFH51812.1 Hypothetical protein Cp267_0911 [Corynebacterium pseudotuberculosis 267]AIG07263.1 hypothetical protein CPTA_01434 [Corynebacterium pseudotuberculosis]